MPYPLNQAQDCPGCGHKLTASSEPTPLPFGAPKAGDLTVCLYCAKVLEYYGQGCRLRAWDENWLRLRHEEQAALRQAIAAVVSVTGGRA